MQINISQNNTVQNKTNQNVRLTQFSHGGGCGCKISPAILSTILSGLPPMGIFPNLMVGLE